MSETLYLPDGTEVGTGLKLPTSTASSFAAYEDIGPMLTFAQIENIARSGTARGRDRFDTSWIKNQRNKNSCQGFASAAAVTRARVRRGLTRVDLSGAYAYSLVNGGRDNGSVLEDGLIACQGGYATEETVPWDKIYPNLYNVQKARAEALRFQAREVYAVRTQQGIASAAALGFDCVVAVHADDGYMQLDSRGVAKGGQGPGNHAVAVDGVYWDGELLFDQPGSWGTTYGHQGRCYLTWNQHLKNTTQYHVFYAIRGAIDDPQDPNTPPRDIAA